MREKRSSASECERQVGDSGRGALIGSPSSRGRDAVSPTVQRHPRVCRICNTTSASHRRNVSRVKPTLNARRVAAEIEATEDQHFQDQRGVLLAWVHGLHTASTPADYMRLQLELRDRFAARQQVAQERRAACSADTEQRNELVSRTPRPQAIIDDLSERIAIRQRLDVRDGIIQHISRCLMDGLAWRVTSYDRALFTVMGDGERVGRLPDEAGAESERDRGQVIWDRGAFPIFNDLTNCLREGDLTVLHGDWRRPDIAIDEVKRSGDRPRTRGRRDASTASFNSSPPGRRPVRTAGQFRCSACPSLIVTTSTSWPRSWLRLVGTDTQTLTYIPGSLSAPLTLYGRWIIGTRRATGWRKQQQRAAGASAKAAASGRPH